MSTYGIGIDFGATTCVVAMSKNGQTEVIPNEMGNRSTNVCVSYVKAADGSSTITVGDAAYNQKERNLPGTVRDFKKLLGQPFDDEITQEDIAESKALKHLEIVEASSSSKSCAIKFAWEEASVPLEDIASLVFAKVRETASLYLGEEVTHCVLTVPSHYSDEKAELLKACCESCPNWGHENSATQLKVMRLLKEPCAALIAHGLDVTPAYLAHRLIPGMAAPNVSSVSGAASAQQGSAATAGGNGLAAVKDEEKTVAVVDLGASTFDCSVFTVNKNSGIFRPVTSVGSGSLGCKLMDETLFDYCVKDLKRKDPKAALQLKKEERAMLRLKEACEKAKKALTVSKRATIEVEALLGDVDFFTQVTREQFEEMLKKEDEEKNVIDQLKEMLEEVQEKVAASTTSSSTKINEYLCIGGGCNIPVVSQTIAEAFSASKAKELKGETDLLAEEVVAMGAAIQADVLLNMGATDEGELVVSAELKGNVEPADDDDTPGIAMEGSALSQAVGISVKKGNAKSFFPVLHKGVPVPVSQKESFACAPGSFNIEVVAADGTPLTTVSIEETSHHHIDLMFSVDGKGSLTVENVTH